MKRARLQGAVRYTRKLTVICATCLLGQLLLSVPLLPTASGDEVMWGSPSLIQRYYGRDSNDVDLSVFPDGNATVVWRQFDGTYYSVYANHYVKGVGWGTEEVIEFDRYGDDFYSGHAWEPKVGALRSGGAAAIWKKEALDKFMFGNTYSTGSGWGPSSRIGQCKGPGIGHLSTAFNPADKGMAVWMEGMGLWDTICSSSYSNGWGSPQTVVTDDGWSWFPDVDVDDGWGAMAVWEHNEYVHASLYDGSDWSVPEQIQTNTASGGFFPKVAVAPSGSAIAVWAQSNGIWANRYSPGTGWGTAESITTQDSIGYQVAIDNNNNAIVVWSQDDGTRHNIWANRFVDGVGWETAELIETNDFGDAMNPEVSVDGSGNAIAVWAESDGTSVSAWANRYIIGTGWGTAQLIESSGGSVKLPKVGLDDAGNGIAVWTQSKNIWANRYIDGVGWGTAELIENDRTYDAEHPQIAVSASGSAMAVWQQLDSGVTSIWASRYTGSGWGTAEVIEPDNNGDAFAPQVAIDLYGNAVVVWNRYEFMLHGFNVIQAGIYTIGSGWTFMWDISSPSGQTEDPQVAVDLNGNAVAVWAAYGGVYANRYVPGTGWGTAETIQGASSDSSMKPQVAVDAGGNSIVVWSQREGALRNIWANRYEVGTGWGTSELIETGGGVASEPQVDVDEGGDAMAVWQQSDGAHTHIWANKYVASVGWGTATLVETNTTTNSTNPVVASDTWGNSITLWEQLGGGVNSIWANRYVEGVGWGTPELIEFDDSGDASSPQISVAPGGNTVAVWHQYDGTRNSIYGNKYVLGDGWGTPELLETNDGDAINPQVNSDPNGKAMTVWQQSDGTSYKIWGDEERISNVTPPTSPVNVQTVSRDNYIELLWDPPMDDGGSPITSYRLYRGTSPGTEVFLSEVKGGTTFTDSCHSPQVNYYYRVSAVNDIGEGPKSPSVAGNTSGALWVGASGVGNCTSIQHALDTALPGDTVRVHGGDYTEHLTIDKPISLIGEDRSTTFVNGVGIQDVVRVTADWVNVSGLTIDSGGTAIGVKLIAADNCTIVDNVISHNKRGIDILHSTNTTLSGNNISHSSQHGVYATASNESTFDGNNVSLNTNGITISDSVLVRFYNNSISGGLYGLNALHSGDIIILNNTISTNTYGSYFHDSSNLTVVYNDVQGNDYGLRFLSPSGTNVVHHNNFIDNGVQATDKGDSVWDDGYPSGGNYWSDYAGLDFYSGPNQDQPGGDGIGDTPRNVMSGPSRDRFPLMYLVHPPPWRPSAPQNLLATAGNAQVTLAWEPPVADGGSPIMNYTIYRGSATGEEVFLAEIGSAVGYLDTGLTNGQTYYYMVSAKNAVGEGPKSNEADATPGTVPGQPLNPTATGNDGKIVLSWSPPLDDGGFRITNYSVYRGPSSGGETHLADIGDILTFTDTGLVNGQAYYYYVRARNSIGEGPTSDEVNAIPATTPSEPLNLAAIAGDGHVTLTWDAPISTGGLQITNYSIYRGETSGSEIHLITVGDVLTYNDTGLVNGQTYFYQVAAINPRGEGTRSAEVKATPAMHPSEPLNIQASSEDGQVTLTWSAPTSDGGSPITNYTIYRGLTSGTVTYLTTVGNVLSHTDTGLVNGQTYFYQVSALNIMGEGPRSGEANATPATHPSEPLNPSATGGDCQVTLTWDIPASDGGSPITNYSIYRGLASGAETYLTTIGDALEYTDTGLVNGRTYYYTVTALNAKGEGPDSTEAFATSMTVPSEPRDLQASPDDGQVTLTWSSPASNGGSPITNYTIYRGLASGAETYLTTTDNVLTYTDTGLVNGQTYYYNVRAVNMAGKGPNSTEVYATPLSTPSEPLNIQATGGNHQVTLTWSAPTSDGGTPVTNYSIHQGTTPGGETLLTEVGNVLTHTITALTNGQTYYYKVSARNSVGEGPRSTEASATPATLPGEPIGFATAFGDSQVMLTWLAPIDDGGSPVINYTVYRGTASGSETYLVTLGNVQTYTDTGLVNGVTYLYTVAAINAVGQGPNSTEASAVPATKPSEPLNLQSSRFWDNETGEGHITLTWTAPLDNGGYPVTNYRIYRGTEPGVEVLLTYIANITSFDDATALVGQTYYYRVSAINVVGEGPKSVVAIETLDPGTHLGGGGTVFDQPWFWAGIIVLIFMTLLISAFFIMRRTSKRFEEDIAAALEEDLDEESEEEKQRRIEEEIASILEGDSDEERLRRIDEEIDVIIEGEYSEE